MKWEADTWQSRLECGKWVMEADRARLCALLGGSSVILASASPRRRDILRLCGVRFRIVDHTLEEPPPHGPDWRGWVRAWATRKAVDSARGLKSGILIAADTIVVLGSQGLGKPGDSRHARAMLRSLSGRTHQVYTGVAVINVTSARKAAGSAVTHVYFRRLSSREIVSYVRSREPLDKAGAYAIQGGGGQFVDCINGPLDNIIGLPVSCLVSVLQRVCIVKNGRNNTSLGLPAGETPPEGPRPNSGPSEIDITKDRLGEVLAARRHQLGLRLEEIAEDIKIRVDYLRAIEQEAFDTLPTAEYSRLFLKSYAERLGLNINDIYALYDVHHRPAWEPARARATVPDPKQPIGPTPRLPATKPIPIKFWIYLAIGLVAIALIIFGVIKLSESGESSSSQSRVAPPPAVTTPAAAGPTQAQLANESDPATTSTNDGIVIDAEMQLVLTFDRDTWVKLVADNDTIASGIYHAGQTVQAKGLDRFVLSLGHTEGVQASVNGHELRAFSTWTRGFGSLMITADSVAAWMLPASVTGGPLQ